MNSNDVSTKNIELVPNQQSSTTEPLPDTFFIEEHAKFEEGITQFLDGAHKGLAKSLVNVTSIFKDLLLTQSRELAIFRRLFNRLQTQSLTDEIWKESLQMLEKIRTEALSKRAGEKS